MLEGLLDSTWSFNRKVKSIHKISLAWGLVGELEEFAGPNLSSVSFKLLLFRKSFGYSR
jgi:hypothetical protein